LITKKAQEYYMFALNILCVIYFVMSPVAVFVFEAVIRDKSMYMIKLGLKTRRKNRKYGNHNQRIFFT